MSSADRHFDETWLMRAMERMECRLLDPVSCSVNNLEACVTAIKE